MTILETMGDPRFFARWFEGPTWGAWRTFLRTLFALPFDEDDQVIYARHTARTEAPHGPFSEAWVVAGRRGGKSLVAALVAVYLACFRDYSGLLKPGEVGTLMVIAADRRQARTIMRYILGFVHGVPMLEALLRNETKESIEIEANGGTIVLEIHTASFRSTRGYTLVAAICDEVAFWSDESGANPDVEIVNALRPGLATIPGSLLLCISSPYARRGALWNAHRRHFGKNSRVLVWQADTRSMNPSIPASVIDAAMEEDESSARAEYGAEFRRDIEGYIDREILERLVPQLPDGARELAPAADRRYVAFVDPAGGSGQDSMTLAIAHTERIAPQLSPRADRAVLDCIREAKPPFSPETIVDQFAETLRTYRINRVTGDRYAGEWPRERFEKAGIRYECSDKVRSDLYHALLPRLNSASVQLLPMPKLISQLASLERRTSRAGRDSIDHGPGGHDDIANAAAGALVLCFRPEPPVMRAR